MIEIIAWGFNNRCTIKIRLCISRKIFMTLKRGNINLPNRKIFFLKNEDSKMASNRMTKS